jgi:hypothetical protein
MALRGKEMTPLGAVGPKTNIDRRNCERQVPMKVLCLGVGRTGTSCKLHPFLSQYKPIERISRKLDRECDNGERRLT